MYFNKSLTEKELLMDLMSSEKQLSSLYNNALVESPCPVLREIYSQCLSNAQSVQFSLFDVTEKRGWHKVQLASDRTIKNMVKKYSEFI